MFKNNVKHLKMFENVVNGKRSEYLNCIETHSEQLL